MVDQDREPNFRENGQLFLVHCYACNLENYLMAVASGTCAWCGWPSQFRLKAYNTLPDKPKKRKKLSQKVSINCDKKNVQ